MRKKRKQTQRFIEKIKLLKKQLNELKRIKSKHRKIEQALSESENKYQALVEKIPAITYTAALDADNSTLYISPQVKAYLGYSQQEFKATPHLRNKILHPDDYVRVLAELVSSRVGDKPFRSEYRLISRNKTILWFRDEAEIVHDKAGRQLFLQGIMYNITERKRAEEELKTLKQQIEFILGVTKTGLDIIDSDFNIVYIDPQWAKVYGPAAGKKCYEYFMGRKEKCPNCGIIEALKTKKPVVREEILIREGNRPVQVTTIPFQNERKEWLVAEVNVDMTQLKKTSEALRESEERFRLIFNNANDGIVLADVATKKLRFGNKRLCQMLGYGPEKIKDLEIKDIHPKEQLPYVLEQFNKQVNREIEIAKDIPVKRKDGSVFYADINSFLLSFGNKTYLAGIFRDITVRKHAEEELKKYREHLEELVKESTAELVKVNEQLRKEVAVRVQMEEKLKKILENKLNFDSVVSHKLKNSLAAINESINIIMDGTAGGVNEKQKEFLEIAKRNVDRLARLINDVLDFQKLESGRMAFDLKENDINETVKEAVKTMHSLAESKGLELLVKVDNDLPKVKFDRDKIIQVLANLINNAIKFTDKGSITVIAAKADNCIKISVKDTGMGIKEKDIPDLFQRFTQLEKGIERKPGGTGLGLAIAREIVEKHKGKIWIESVFGQGSVFYFVLPVNG